MSGELRAAGLRRRCPPAGLAGFEIAAAGFAAAFVVGAFAAGFAGAFVVAEEWRVVRVVGIVNPPCNRLPELEFTARRLRAVKRGPRAAAPPLTTLP